MGGGNKSGTREGSRIAVRKRSWQLVMAELLRVGLDRSVRENVSDMGEQVGKVSLYSRYHSWF